MNAECTKCGASKPKKEMLARRVQFVELGKGGSVRRSRTTDWLCASCVAADPAWSLPEYQAAPGQRVMVDNAE